MENTSKDQKYKDIESESFKDNNTIIEVPNQYA